MRVLGLLTDMELQVLIEYHNEQEWLSLEKHNDSAKAQFHLDRAKFFRKVLTEPQRDPCKN